MLEIKQLDVAEEQAIMELTTSWKEEGRREGLNEGRRAGLEEGLTVALEVRFGDRARLLAERLSNADEAALDSLKAIVRTASWEQVDELLS